MYQVHHYLNVYVPGTSLFKWQIVPGTSLFKCLIVPGTSLFKCQIVSGTSLFKSLVIPGTSCQCFVCTRYIQAASTPKNIIILLDTSGSMTGKRFTIAQSTVSTILETLSDEDYFNIIKVQLLFHCCTGC